MSSCNGNCSSCASSSCGDRKKESLLENLNPLSSVKKVIAVILVILVIAMFIIAVKKLVQSDNKNNIVATTYFTIYSNNKWGVIDNNANIIVEPTYDEMIIIPNIL